MRSDWQNCIAPGTEWGPDRCKWPQPQRQKIRFYSNLFWGQLLWILHIYFLNWRFHTWSLLGVSGLSFCMFVITLCLNTEIPSGDNVYRTLFWLNGPILLMLFEFLFTPMVLKFSSLLFFRPTGCLSLAAEYWSLLIYSY